MLPKESHPNISYLSIYWRNSEELFMGSSHEWIHIAYDIYFAYI
jgi:hypothetical protein